MKPTEAHPAAEATLSLAQALIAAWNDPNLDNNLSFYTPDYEGVDVGEAGPHYGPDGIRQSLIRYRTAFPDLHFVADTPIIEKNRLVLAWTARGTHRGKLMNIPPTGYEVEVRGVSLLTLSGNQISRGFYIWDVAGLLRCLGLLPDL